MITFTIEKMPNITIRPIGESMRMISERLGQTVRENFNVGGRPPWLPTRANLTQPLLGKGGLFSSITESSGEDWAEVSTDLIYARTHQQGRSFIPTPKQKGFFWAQYFDTLNEKWKWMALAANRGRMFYIPARPFMVLQPEDMDFIFNTLGQGSVRISTEGGAFIPASAPE